MPMYPNVLTPITKFPDISEERLNSLTTPLLPPTANGDPYRRPPYLFLANQRPALANTSYEKITDLNAFSQTIAARRKLSTFHWTENIHLAHNIAPSVDLSAENFNPSILLPDWYDYVAVYEFKENPNLGYGLFAKQPISKGKTLFPYAGLILKTELLKNGETIGDEITSFDSYVMRYDKNEPQQTRYDISAKQWGGIAGFIQSCPSVSEYTNLLGSVPPSCQLAFANTEIHFYRYQYKIVAILKATTDINPGEMLSYDYQEAYWKQAYKQRGILPKIFSKTGELVKNDDVFIKNYRTKCGVDDGSLISPYSQAQAREWFTRANQKFLAAKNQEDPIVAIKVFAQALTQYQEAHNIINYVRIINNGPFILVNDALYACDEENASTLYSNAITALRMISCIEHAKQKFDLSVLPAFYYNYAMKFLAVYLILAKNGVPCKKSNPKELTKLIRELDLLDGEEFIKLLV